MEFRMGAARYVVLTGDCLPHLRTLPANSVHACVTDPQYGLSEDPDIVVVLTEWLAGRPFIPPRPKGFMEQEWDAFVPGPEYWREVLRVLKPGGHLLAFGGGRTFDLLAIACRLAGFERRDTISHDTVMRWYYGSGKPWSQDVSKFVDKAVIADRTVAVEAVLRAQGYIGIIWADAKREKEYKLTVQMTFHVTVGGVELDIESLSDGSFRRPPYLQGRKKKRIEGRPDGTAHHGQRAVRIRNPKCVGGGHGSDGGDRPWMREAKEKGFHETEDDTPVTHEGEQWNGWQSALKPAWEPILVCRKPLSEDNLARNVLAHSTGAMNVEACRVGHRIVGWKGGPGFKNTHNASLYGGLEKGEERPVEGNWPANLVVSHHPACGAVCVRDCPVRTLGRPAQFFYCPKPDRTERDAGIQGEPKPKRRVNRGGVENDPKWADVDALNDHETCKPVALMRYLVALVTPPGGLVLDPFAGSGTTGVAAMHEGMRFLGMELRGNHAENARQRIGHAAGETVASLRESPVSQLDLFSEAETVVSESAG
jgi:DNA modification methylase